METDKMIFGDKQYVIRKTLYRTIGSRQQKLTTTKNDQAERRRTFYVVERDGRLFWVKEYTEPAPCHDINYEFAETNRMHATTGVGRDEIRTVKMLCIEGDRLLMEYCADYMKIHEAKLTPQQKTLARRLIAKWLQEHPEVHNYDMCGNNVLIKTDGNISIRLIDFEYSLKMSRQQWEHTSNAECWYRQAGAIKFSGIGYRKVQK